MSVRLYYADGRGRAEIIRIVLAFADVEYTEFDFTTREQWLDFIKEGKPAFNQVPLLEIDGLNLVQTGAIVRYLARKYNLMGSNDREAALIDMYFEGTRDFYTPFLEMCFQDEKTVVQRIQTTSLPKYLPAFEKILGSNDSPYMVGGNISIADLGLLECLLVTEDYYGLSPIEAYPKLKDFYSLMKAHNKISTYLNSSTRRKKNDMDYIATVRKVLNF